MENQNEHNTRPLDDFVGQISSSALQRLMAVRLIRHRTPNDLYLKFLKPMMEDVGETDPNQIILCDQYTPGDMARIIKDMGFWGYASTKEGIIHCWWKRGCSRHQLVAFVCHELEHMVRKCQPKDEEKRCDLTGAIGVRALQLLGL